MKNPFNHAPGWPGMPPSWSSSAKSGVGTSLGPASRVWFTIGHGILNEIYFPRIDQACTRDMGIIVTDGKEFFSEEKRDAASHLTSLARGVPAFHLTNNCKLGRYRIEKDILADPKRDVVLQKTLFMPTYGSLEEYRLFVILAPHLGNRGWGNTAWIGEYKGVQMLFAQRENNALALACSAPWLNRSAGFVGVSDGWQDLAKHRRMTFAFERAENGNVALTAEIDLQASGGGFILALGFGSNFSEAGNLALSSLLEGFEASKNKYIWEWLNWQKASLPCRENRADNDLCSISKAVIRTHEAKEIPGGIIASLSFPWGFARGDDDLDGYHLVWPRDLAEAGGALLAAGASRDVHRVLHYLQVTQGADGHWPRNMWLDGTPYLDGTQIEETSYPILLVDMVLGEKALDEYDIGKLWPMVRKAAGFILRNGPVTQQDRWEEDPGYSPFTLAVEITALLIAADLADLNSEQSISQYLRETADAWNICIERWTYVTNTEIAQRTGVEGYYAHIAPLESANAASPSGGFVPIKNWPAGRTATPAIHIIGADALALVRFGLRSPDDQRIINTIKVIDALLKVETPHGPAWHRYNNDRYGEHEDGRPFDGTGTGRIWPLLTGERAHYELSAGRYQEAERLLKTMEAFAGEGGMFPEQVWDTHDIPEKELFFRKPSGSAMPLVWAHAEYIKLLRSLRDKSVFDTPRQTVRRYIQTKTDSPFAIWRFNHKCRTMPAGKTLRIELLAPATVHWSSDNWRTEDDIDTRDTGLDIHIADLSTAGLPDGTVVKFTFYWPQGNNWEGKDFEINVAASQQFPKLEAT